MSTICYRYKECLALQVQEVILLYRSKGFSFSDIKKKIEDSMHVALSTSINYVPESSIDSEGYSTSKNITDLFVVFLRNHNILPNDAYFDEYFSKFMYDVFILLDPPNRNFNSNKE